MIIKYLTKKNDNFLHPEKIINLFCFMSCIYQKYPYLYIIKQKEIMTTQIFKTNEKTLNNKVKAYIKANVIGLAGLVKKHVAGIGYVFYMKDASNNNLGFVYKEGGTIKVEIKN